MNFYIYVYLVVVLIAHTTHDLMRTDHFMNVRNTRWVSILINN